MDDIKAPNFHPVVHQNFVSIIVLGVLVHHHPRSRLTRIKLNLAWLTQATLLTY